MKDALPDAVNAPIVELSHVSLAYDLSEPWLTRLMKGEPSRTLMAIRDVDLSIPRGSVIAVIGERGAGKTTLARLAAGLLAPSAGRVQMLAGARPQMLFHGPGAGLDPLWPVRRIILEPAPRGLARPQADARVSALLTRVGLSPSVADLRPRELTPGRRQLVAIARVLAADPSVVICDDPTAGLDVSEQATVFSLLRELQLALGLSCLVLSRGLAAARYLADTVGVMYLGRVVEIGPRDAIWEAPRHPYTRMLLDAAPKVTAFGQARPAPPGERPDPVDPPSGCAYHPRCPLATRRCRHETPQTILVEDRKVACHAVAAGRA